MAKINLINEEKRLGESQFRKEVAGKINDLIDVANSLPAVQRTITQITYDKDAIYGTPDSPITTNLTGNSLGATVGVTGLIVHNAGSEPSYPTGFAKLASSGNYTPGVLNFIFFTYLNSTNILYTITQKV